MKVIPYGCQNINQDDIDAVLRVLKSDFLTQGPEIPAFEEAVCSYTQAKYGVSANSATSCLHLACLALGLTPQDTLWTSPNTFVASANCGLYCGAKIDFVDIDPLTYNMCVHALEEKLKKAKVQNKLPKIVVPVHFAGQSCDMQKIKSLADEYGFYIVEDASHAIGGRYLDQPVGNCAYSDIAVFSFHPVKVITCAEGGMLTTNNPDLADRARTFRTHGVTRDITKMQGESHGPWYYQMLDLGLNYRMTDMQAALGSSQLKRLDQFVAFRNDLAQKYCNEFEGLPIDLPYQEHKTYSSWHLFVICLKDQYEAKTRRQAFEALRSKGIGVNVHYIPVHTQPFYQRLGFKKGDFPVSEAYYERCISLPLYFDMSVEDQERVIDTVREIFQ